MDAERSHGDLLSVDAKRQFKRTGFLVLEDVLDKEVVQEARELLWEAIPEDPTDADSLFARDGAHVELFHRKAGDQATELSSVAPFEHLYRAVYPVAEELVGTGVLAEPDERPAEYCLHGGHLLASRSDGGSVVDHAGAVGPILQYPSDIRSDLNATYDYREGWHVDGGVGPYVPDGSVEYLPFTIACAVYFDTVEPRGGGFTVWPGSHRRTERYFQDHTYGDYIAGDDVLASLDPGPAHEITGPAGTLVLWHHNIIHGPAPNHSERIRMAGFQRIAHRDIDEIRQGGLSDIWSMYPAIRDLEPRYHRTY